MKPCPKCAEQIQDEAIKCRHCGTWLNEPSAPTVTAGTRTCPACAETIQAEAIKCRHCGTWLNRPPEAPPAIPARADEVDSRTGLDAAEARDGKPTRPMPPRNIQPTAPVANKTSTPVAMAEKRRRRSLLIVGGGILLGIVAVSAVGLILHSRGKSSEEDSQKNSNAKSVPGAGPEAVDAPVPAQQPMAEPKPGPHAAPVVEPPKVQEETQIKVRTVTASTFLPPYQGTKFWPQNLVDGDLETSWQPKGSNQDCVGQWFQLDLGAPVMVGRIAIANGYQTMSSGGDEFFRNHRLNSATITFSNGTSEVVSFPSDRKGFVSFPVSPRSVTWIRVQIDSVHRGTDYKDVAVSEVQVYGPASQASR